MENNQTQSRYNFIKSELQLIICSDLQNVKMKNWRKTYENHNEWKKVMIADKVGAFFNGFQECALSCVHIRENPGNQPISWFEQFGWRTHTIHKMRNSIGLSIEDLCMYIEFEMEYEETFKSAREVRYIQREEYKQGLADGIIEL